MRGMIRLQLLLVVALALLTGLAMSVAQLRGEPRSPVRRGAFCELPCWRGIQPGETLIAQANRIMMAQGYIVENSASSLHFTPPEDRLDCQVSVEHRDARVTEVRLSNCPDLRLGDTLAALGQPDHLAPNLLTMGFDDGSVRLQLRSPGCGEHLSPFTDVQFISLSESPWNTAEDTAPHWQGFALPWRYLRAVPNILVLAAC